MDLILEDSVLELQDLSDPFLYWPARVLQNVGGRLRLRYAGLTDEHRAQDAWIFYLDVRLRPLGWALENHLTLEPPTGEDLTSDPLTPFHLRLDSRAQESLGVT